MSKNFKNFTSGSQLLESFSLMFAAGFKAPAWITLILFAGSCYWHFSTMLSDHAGYLALMKFEGICYNWFDFDPNKAVNIQTGSGGTIQLTWGTLGEYEPMTYAWAEAIAALWRATWMTLLFVVPAFTFYCWYAIRFGKKARQRAHLGGAQLVSYGELVSLVKERNQPQRATDMRAHFGNTWPLQSRLVTPQELDAAGIYRPYTLAGVPFPYRLEQSHVMLIGTTGTGKTVELSKLVTQIRERNHRAVIFDLTGAFIERFYDEERDVILNPLDARCPQWSIFNECDSEAEFTTAWEALVPHDGGGSDPFWVQAARMLGVETCLKLMAEGRTTNGALYRELMTADLKHVHKLVERTLADPITAPEAARMAESVRAVLNTNAKPIRLLPDAGPSFSIKTWMMDDAGDGGLLFLSARYVDMAVSKTLLTCWLDTALNTLMTMPRTRDVRMWFLVDELGALHRLSALEKGLQTARNYGGAIVLGVHAFGKLSETYGQNVAQTIASLARTKLLLATDDRPTATFESDCIGHRQFREMEEGYSYGFNNMRDAMTLTPRRNLEPLVLPDDIMNLENLNGYLKYPSGFPAAAVRLTYVDYPSYSEGFIKRDLKPHPEPTAPAPAPQSAPTAPPPGQEGAGKKGEGSEAPTANNPDGGSGIPIDPPAEGEGAPRPLEKRIEAENPEREKSPDERSIEAARNYLDNSMPVPGAPGDGTAASAPVPAIVVANSDGESVLVPPPSTRRAGDDGNSSGAPTDGKGGDATQVVLPGRPPVGRAAPRSADLTTQELNLAFGPEKEQHHHNDHHSDPVVDNTLNDSLSIDD